MFDRHYARAPIVEAVIDVQVESASPPDQSAFTTYAEKWTARFPQRADLNLFQVGFGPFPIPGMPHHVQASQGQVVGVRLSSALNDRTLQVQTRGLSYSHLPPYSRWEEFFDEFAELWRSYVELIKPETVTRVALRYINQIAIPHQKFEMSDFFSLYPEVPTGIPQDITGLFMQLQMPQPDLGPDVMAIVNLGTGARNAQGQNAFLLDFDVFANRRLVPTSGDLAELLGAIRVRKNQLFEACITDKTRELIR